MACCLAVATPLGRGEQEGVVRALHVQEHASNEEAQRGPALLQSQRQTGRTIRRSLLCAGVQWTAACLSPQGSTRESLYGMQLPSAPYLSSRSTARSSMLRCPPLPVDIHSSQALAINLSCDFAICAAGHSRTPSLDTKTLSRA